jgi:carbonic anhydrase
MCQVPISVDIPYYRSAAICPLNPPDGSLSDFFSLTLQKRENSKLGLLSRIGQVVEAIPGGGNEFHLIVLQHTDCGMTRLAGDPDMLTEYFEISKEALKSKAVTDPRAAVAVDVAVLKATPALPAEWIISGLVYDVSTGLIDVVVPPAPLR